MADPKRLESSRTRSRLPIATAGPKRCSSKGSTATSPAGTKTRSTSGRACCSSIARTRAPAPTSIAPARRSPNASASREEMLQASQDLLEQGRTEAARTCSTEAVDQRATTSRAAALRVKLERLERARAARSASPAASGAPVRRRPRRRAGGGRGAHGRVLVAGAARGRWWSSWRSPCSPAVPTGLACGHRRTARAGVGRAEVAASLSSADVALVRARNLYSRGRLAEALQALDRVEPDSPARPAADELRIEIQQLLLAVDRARRPPRRTDDEMSEVPLPELRARAALQALRLRPRRSRTPISRSRPGRRRARPLDFRLRDDVDPPLPPPRPVVPVRESHASSVTMPLRRTSSAVGLAEPPARCRRRSR